MVVGRCAGYHGVGQSLSRATAGAIQCYDHDVSMRNHSSKRRKWPISDAVTRILGLAAANIGGPPFVSGSPQNPQPGVQTAGTGHTA